MNEGKRVLLLREEVRAAIPKILARHAGPVELAHALPLPGGRREKVVLRVRGAETPLILRIYAPRETAALENGLVAVRALESRGSVPVGHCCGFDRAPSVGPFCYRLHDMMWGTDAERLLAAGALGPADVAAIGAAIGEALAGLHELCADGFGEPRHEPHERAKRLTDYVRDEVERAGPSLGELFLRAAPALDASPARPRLTHRRFDAAAVIVRREAGRFVLSGLAALDGARFFDPAWDLLGLEDGLFAREPALGDPFREAYRSRMHALPACEPEVAALYRALRGCAAPDERG